MMTVLTLSRQEDQISKTTEFFDDLFSSDETNINYTRENGTSIHTRGDPKSVK